MFAILAQRKVAAAEIVICLAMLCSHHGAFGYLCWSPACHSIAHVLTKAATRMYTRVRRLPVAPPVERLFNPCRTQGALSSRTLLHVGLPAAVFACEKYCAKTLDALVMNVV